LDGAWIDIATTPKSDTFLMFEDPIDIKALSLTDQMSLHLLTREETIQDLVVHMREETAAIPLHQLQQRLLITETDTASL